MENQDLQDRIDDATLDFTLGDNASALSKLEAILAEEPGTFAALHAITEVRYAMKDFDGALAAAENAHALKPDDAHINTSLSRIWIELGDKEKAEHFGGQARMMSWRDEIKDGES